MTRTIRILSVALAGLLLAGGAFAQARDPLLGSWKLNRSKSSYNPGPAPASRTMKFEVAGDGIRHVVETFVNNGSGTDEGVHIADYTARFDSSDNAIRGSALDTVSLKRVNSQNRRAHGQGQECGRRDADVERIRGRQDADGDDEGIKRRRRLQQGGSVRQAVDVVEELAEPRVVLEGVHLRIDVERVEPGRVVVAARAPAPRTRASRCPSASHRMAR